MRSSFGGSARRLPANSIAYIAMSIDAFIAWSGSTAAMSGSWPLVFRSASSWMRPQSSSGRPISSPITRDGSLAVTSWTNSTSPCSRASAMIAWQMSRMRSSSPPMTRALKWGDSGSR